MTYLNLSKYSLNLNHLATCYNFEDVFLRLLIEFQAIAERPDNAYAMICTQLMIFPAGSSSRTLRDALELNRDHTVSRKAKPIVPDSLYQQS